MKNNYILVQEIKQEETKTASGIIIPEEKYNRKVKVINSGNCDSLKKGDVVLKNIGKGTAVTLDNIEFEIINVSQLIAVIEDNG